MRMNCFIIKITTSCFYAFASSPTQVLRKIWLVTLEHVRFNAGSDNRNLNSFLPHKTKAIHASLGVKHSWLCLHLTNGPGSRFFFFLNAFLSVKYNYKLSINNLNVCTIFCFRNLGCFISSKWTPGKQIMLVCLMNVHKKKAGLCVLI